MAEIAVGHSKWALKAEAYNWQDEAAIETTDHIAITRSATRTACTMSYPSGKLGDEILYCVS